MTTHQLAEELGIGYSNAACLMKSKGFPSFRVGRQLLVHPDDFAQWRSQHVGCTVPARTQPKVEAKTHKKPVKRYLPMDFSKIDYFA